MSKSYGPPFDPNALAKWLADGLKETIQYRFKNAISKEKIMELIQSKIPNRNQLVHHALKQALLKGGFSFESLKLGDAHFQLIRKKYRKTPPGQKVRRIILIPGLGDSPSSWLATLGLSKREWVKNYDEILVLDFPGYLGFLSHHPMSASMSVMLSAVKLVCESNPPTVLIGHSLGGWLAGKISQQLEQTFEHLILIAPSGLIPEEERKTFADFILSQQKVRTKELIEKVIHEPKKYHSLLEKEFNQFYSKSEIPEFIKSVNAEHFIEPNVPFACKKVSVIWGENDVFVPSHWIRHWIENFGSFTSAYVLKKTGHLPQIERPKVLSEVLLNAIFDRPALEGELWKRIHTRVKEAQVERRTSQLNLIT